MIFGILLLLLITTVIGSLAGSGLAGFLAGDAVLVLWLVVVILCFVGEECVNTWQRKQRTAVSARARARARKR